MEKAVYTKHQKLTKFPLLKLGYIVYRRLLEHGARATFLWIYDKLIRRLRGFSPPGISEVCPGLYVGGQQYPHGLRRMWELGITAVVNMREEADDAERGVALEHYLWLPTTDDAPPSHEDLARGAAFITAQRAAGHGVYIHCAAGVGRAPTMAVAYLISTGMTVKEAWDTVYHSRPFIRPTPPQFEAIDAFGENYDKTTYNE